MKYILLLVLLIGVCSATAQNQPCDRTVNGTILDLHTREPLPFASIQIVGTEKGATSDEEGHFVITGICKEEVHLEIRFLGYKTVTHHHDFHHPNPTILMATDATLLEGVVVEETIEKDMQSLSIRKKELSKMEVVGNSIGNLTGEMSGVSLLQTGSNISKPMIHGLHSNRVLVINDGVRHAYQVWGQEHAPEIDPSHVDQIEIVKGAGTVKYGPDALGGVILYQPKKPTFEKDLQGSIGAGFQSNGQAVSNQVNLEQGFHRFAWNAAAFGTVQGDLQAPNYNLSNTGKREFGGSFNTLWHRPLFDLQLSGSYFRQNLGILRGSIVGNLDDLQRSIERSSPTPTSSFTYDIQNPRQRTIHGLIKTNASFYLGEHIVNVQYAFQRNTRLEFDVRRGELNNRPVIDLGLSSHTIDTEWIQPQKGRWKGNSGVQLFTQKSKNTPGSNPVNFVPDYSLVNVGAFTVQSLDFDRTTLEFGLRLDYQALSVSDLVRNSFAYSNEVTYANGTFSLGFTRELSDGFSFFTNLGSSWRAPNVAELYSFGYHNSRLQFGLWRYTLEPKIATPQDAVLDENDRPVPAEQGFKWVAGLELKKTRTTAEFILFANQINNFIFQRPFGISTGSAGTFPYFFYDQTDAVFLGSDWDVRYQHNDKMTSEIKISYVYAYTTENNQALLEVPPLNLTYQLESKAGNWSYGLLLNYTAKQWNAPPVTEPIAFQNGEASIDRSVIFDFMSPPDAFALLGVKVGYEKNRWSARLQVDNLLNTPYRIYTDRLRYFADAPGRNIRLGVEFTF